MTSPEDSNRSSSDATSDDASVAGSPPPASPRGSRALNRLFKLVVICAGTLATVYGMLWWQDRPLREVAGLLDRKQPQVALAKANLYLSSSPDNVRLKALKARALIDSGKAAEGIAIFEEIGLETAPEIYAMARGYMQQAAWTRAVQLLKRVMAHEPRNVEALQDLIGCEFQAGLHRDGMADAEALTKSGDAARGWAWQAFFSSAVDDYDPALVSFANALAKAPDGKSLPVSADEFFLRYGQTAAGAGKTREAREMLERSMAVAPSAAALAELAKLRQAEGDAQGASQLFERAIEFDPAQPDACEALAAQAITAGDFDRAQRRLAPLAGGALHRLKTAELLLAIFEQKNDATEVRRWKARVKQMQSREELDAAIKRVQRENPASFWPLVVRAHDFASAGNANQADEMLQALPAEALKETFVQDLAVAIQQRAPLPPLERLPREKF